MAQGGKICKHGENVSFFFPPLHFLEVFLSKVRKKPDQGEKWYFVSSQAHIQEAI
jgi:hypothetical protein